MQLRQFRTFPSSGERARFSFAFGSCIIPNPLRDLSVFQYWREELGVDLGLLIGDSVYSDAVWPMPPREQLYRQLLSDKHLEAFLQTRPTFFQNDDHVGHLTAMSMHQTSPPLCRLGACQQLRWNEYCGRGEFMLAPSRDVFCC